MRILFIGAHPDDVEIGCGGLMSRINSPKNDLHYSAISMCGTDNGLGFTSDELMEDVKSSMVWLNIPWGNVSLFDFPNTRLPEKAYEIRQVLENLRKDIEPEMVYVHSPHDLHQDHVAVSLEAMRAFRGVELRFYEGISTGHQFNPNLYVDITGYEGMKTACLKCYSTQARRKYFDPLIWLDKARLRGLEAGVIYAEAYQLRWRLE